MLFGNNQNSNPFSRMLTRQSLNLGTADPFTTELANIQNQAQMYQNGLINASNSINTGGGLLTGIVAALMGRNKMADFKTQYEGALQKKADAQKQENEMIQEAYKTNDWSKLLTSTNPKLRQIALEQKLKGGGDLKSKIGVMINDLNTITQKRNEIAAKGGDTAPYDQQINALKLGIQTQAKNAGGVNVNVNPPVKNEGDAYNRAFNGNPQQTPAAPKVGVMGLPETGGGEKGKGKGGEQSNTFGVTSKSTGDKITKDFYATGNILQQVDSIMHDFDPKFMSKPLAFKEGAKTFDRNYLGGLFGSNDREGIKNSLEYQNFKAKAGLLFIERLKENSGAAVTAIEMERNKQYLPTLQGFDSDDHVKFFAKANALRHMLLLGQLRRLILVHGGAAAQTIGNVDINQVGIWAKNHNDPKIRQIYEIVSNGKDLGTISDAYNKAYLSQGGNKPDKEAYRKLWGYGATRPGEKPTLYGDKPDNANGLTPQSPEIKSQPSTTSKSAERVLSHPVYGPQIKQIKDSNLPIEKKRQMLQQILNKMKNQKPDQTSGLFNTGQPAFSNQVANVNYLAQDER